MYMIPDNLINLYMILYALENAYMLMNRQREGQTLSYYHIRSYIVQLEKVLINLAAKTLIPASVHLTILGSC